MFGLNREEIKLVEYNQYWEKLFQKEKEVLEKTLQPGLIEIEHVGSTAIKGIKAKPVIGIMAGLNSINSWQKHEKKLREVGYEFEADNLEEKDHILFIKTNKEGKILFNLKLTEHNSRSWNNNIFFRDFLTKNKEKAQEYETLKISLFKKYKKDKEKYNHGKDSFVKEILKLNL